MGRRSKQGAASPLKGLMLPRQPVSHGSNERETPRRVRMLALVGFVVERLSFVVLGGGGGEEISLKAK